MNIEPNEQVIAWCVCSGVSTFVRTNEIDVSKMCMSLGGNVMIRVYTLTGRAWTISPKLFRSINQILDEMK